MKYTEYIKTASTIEQDALHQDFHSLTVNEFEELMKIALFKTVRKGSKEEVLVEKGESLDKLYYVRKLGVKIIKNERYSQFMPKVFIGEIVYLLGGVTSATVMLPPKTDYIEWNSAELKSLPQTIQYKLDKMIGVSMAQKIRSF